MGEMTVRRARAADATGVAALIEVMGGHDGVTAGRGWAGAFADVVAHQERRGLVAEEDGEVVGYVEVQARPSVLHGRREAWLAALAVSPRRRRTGLGRALVERAVGAAAALGCDVVVVESSAWRHDAAALYLALGFEEAAAARRFERPVGPPGPGSGAGQPSASPG